MEKDNSVIVAPRELTFERQTKFYSKEKQTRGNCMAACYANYLGLRISQIPAFEELFTCTKPHGFWFTVVLLFWKEMGYNYVSGSKHDVPKNDYYFVSGVSPRDSTINHMVIYKNGELYFDPHPDGTGIVPGTESEFEWVSLIK